jgi:hypothetical protein
MSATETLTGLQAVKAAVKNFEAVQWQYSSHGACDTEPDGIFQGILWKIYNDEDAAIPQTGNGWELYASSMDCTEAANALHLAALGVVQAIFACSMKESREVRKYLEEYCWRYN